MKTAFAICLLMSLAACGLRGDLERPDPIFSSRATEEAKQPVDTFVEPTEEVPEDGVYLNPLGGEIPRAVPSEEIGSDGMGEVGPG